MLTSKLFFHLYSFKANREIIAISEAKRFITDCFVALKTPQEHAELMADLIVVADYRGHFSHGMNRLEVYLNDLLTNSTDASVKPKVLKETPATAWVDGCNGLGAVVGRFCMDLAIQKAKTVGVGWVCAKDSNHYGIAGWHALYAEQHGLIGISMTNSSPSMCPTRSSQHALGTNPISLAAPAENGDSFVLDMATTAVALGKIELQRRKGESIPSGWAQGPDGNITTDANVAFDTNCLLPLGGSEITSGYKGYGLGALVEVLCGISADANFAVKLRSWSLTSDNDRDANLGQLFIAVDPDSFAPGFTNRLTEMNGILRNLPPVSMDSVLTYSLLILDFLIL